jgi:DUF1009 family protein
VGGGDVIGLIAGAGRLPVILAEAVKARGHELVCVTIEGDGRALEPIADAAYHAGFGEIERIITILRRHRAHRVLMAGQVQRRRMVGEGDHVFRRRLAATDDRRDQAAFRAVVRAFAEHGIAVVSPLEFIGHLLIGPGVLTARAPNEAEWDDIWFGMQIGRAIADLDIGQTVVVKSGVILAVEAAEGTDAAIRRAGTLADGGVVVKVARSLQDERFDLPAIGPQTLASLIEAKAAVLAVEAGRTFLLDRAETSAAADQHGIAIVGVELTGPGLRAPGSG